MDQRVPIQCGALSAKHHEIEDVQSRFRGCSIQFFFKEKYLNVQLIPEAITRRRSQYEGCGWLSDWQVHSANVTASAINTLAHGLETGPLYVPMPTGSGKTTGAIWGIIDFA